MAGPKRIKARYGADLIDVCKRLARSIDVGNLHVVDRERGAREKAEGDVSVNRNIASQCARKRGLHPSPVAVGVYEGRGDSQHEQERQTRGRGFQNIGLQAGHGFSFPIKSAARAMRWAARKRSSSRAILTVARGSQKEAVPTSTALAPAMRNSAASSPHAIPPIPMTGIRTAAGMVFGAGESQEYHIERSLQPLS